MIRRLQTYAGNGAGLLRSVFDVVRWPFERAAWAIERAVIWPIRERTANWNTPVRAVAIGSVALLAAGAVAFGLTQGSDGDEGTPALATAPASVPVKAAAPEPAPEPAEPVLRGAVPDFTPKPSDAADAKVADADAVIAAEPDAATSSTPSSSATASSSSVDEKVKDPGPAAIDVARRFSSAFVIYETGKTDAKVRTAFAATATPQLARALLQRPPRLPASAKVPKAKVLNVVPGPRSGDTFTLSAALLRVGITSELRIDVERDEKTNEWQVTDVLG